MNWSLPLRAALRGDLKKDTAEAVVEFVRADQGPGSAELVGDPGRLSRRCSGRPRARAAPGGIARKGAEPGIWRNDGVPAPQTVLDAIQGGPMPDHQPGQSPASSTGCAGLNAVVRPRPAAQQRRPTTAKGELLRRQRHRGAFTVFAMFLITMSRRNYCRRSGFVLAGRPEGCSNGSGNGSERWINVGPAGQQIVQLMDSAIASPHLRRHHRPGHRALLGRAGLDANNREALKRRMCGHLPRRSRRNSVRGQAVPERMMTGVDVRMRDPADPALAALGQHVTDGKVWLDAIRAGGVGRLTIVSQVMALAVVAAVHAGSIARLPRERAIGAAVPGPG